jgi:hypothetical protein
MKPALRIFMLAAGVTVFATACGNCGNQSDFHLMVKASIGEIAAGDEPDPLGDIGNPSVVGRKSVARAMLLSAVLPGLGQIYAGGRRGYAVGGAMAALDVLSAWQYYDNNRKGDDLKTDYKAFARDHYDRGRFREYVRDTVVVFSGSDVFESCTVPGSYDSAECWASIDNVFPLSDRDDAAFYEQIGEENRYVFGWDDWNPYGTADHQDLWIDWDPYSSLPEGIPRTSSHRDQYGDMKQDADDYYGKADRYAWIMVVGRVVSMIDAAILVKLRNRDLAALGDNPRLSFKAGFNGGPNFRVGVKVRF